jgi:hypothetical protein
MLSLRWGLRPIRLSSVSLLDSDPSRERCNVETFAEMLSAVMAIVLTVACGLLLEELVFGGLARLFFVGRPSTSEKPSPAQENKGERTCLP